MKKSTVLQGVVGVVIAMMAVGCATCGGGASDEEQIQALLAKWEQACVAADMDQLMATISDDFAHKGYEYEAADKEELAAFIEYSIDEGYLDGVEISFEDADVEIDGDTATIYPIDFLNDVGAATVELVAKKEKGGWIFVDMIIEGI
ncbi:MAG: hypothetical protein GWP08_06650 [Nitrospiraceae bacterium]|nr:hypothetical protein [Nitrospiraceae bacterium]